MRITKFLLPILILSVILSCKKEDDKPIEDNNQLDNNDTTQQDSTFIPPAKYELIKITTDLGNIVIWLYDETPLHKNNFLKLTNEGFYDSLIFHRVIDDFMIQGGDPSGNGTGGPGYQIDAEIDTSFTHVQGAVAAARLPNSMNPAKKSSGSQFYIVENVDGAHWLDGEYSIFGTVLEGIATVESIGSVITNSQDKPLSDVYMTSVDTFQLTADQILTTYGFEIE